MIHIDVNIVFGDYEIPHQDQEYHEHIIKAFKGNLHSIVKAYPQQITTPIAIECEYYPQKRKFKITSIGRAHKTRLDYTLGMNDKFVKQYLL